MLIYILKKIYQIKLINKHYLVTMNSFNIIMVIAIILFARLGVKLVTGYIKMKKEKYKTKN